jgi:hypothetical protein
MDSLLFNIASMNRHEVPDLSPLPAISLQVLCPSSEKWGADSHSMNHQIVLLCQYKTQI